MYKIEISGCFTFLLFCLLVLFLIKELWWLIIGIILAVIIFYYAKVIYNTFLNKNNEENKNYTPEMGEVYKICPYCNTKLKINATCCPVCKHALN